MDDSEHFDLKWPVTQRAVTRHARRLHLRPEDVADLLQAAALLLWHTVTRGVPSINSEWVAKGAMSSWLSRNKRHTGVSLNGWGDRVPAKSESICVDGVTLTTTDARMDSPELCELWVNGVGMTTVAGRLGLSRPRIFQRAAELGGHRFEVAWGKRATWRFPADTRRTDADLDGTMGAPRSPRQCLAVAVA